MRGHGVKVQLVVIKIRHNLVECFTRSYATQHNDVQHNDAQHNDAQHNDVQHDDVYHTGVSIMILSIT
jgi:hypothetical protein